MNNKQWFAIYNIDKEKFLLDKTDTENRHPYSWFTLEELLANGERLLVLGETTIDSYIGFKQTHNDLDLEVIGPVGVHVINYLEKQHGWNNIMIVPLAMSNNGVTGVPDFIAGFKL